MYHSVSRLVSGRLSFLSMPLYRTASVLNNSLRRVSRHSSPDELCCHELRSALVHFLATLPRDPADGAVQLRLALAAYESEVIGISMLTWVVKTPS